VDTTNALIEGLIELSQVGKLSQKLPLALATEVKKISSELESFAKDKQVHIENSAK
jgi:hypothetical protein